MSISVVICCYNGERYLRETLNSLRAQTLPPLEIIVVDDGSADGSAALAESFGDPVRVIRQPNQGLPASRNVGIMAARGKYLFFIDADDLIHATALERLYSAAEQADGAVAVMGYAAFVNDVQQPIVTKSYNIENFFPELIHGNFGPQHNRLVTRELALRAGCFDPKMYLFEDWLFWCRVALCDARLAPVDFVGAYYRRHAATMSYTALPIASLRGHVRVMEELSDGMLKRPDLLHAHGQDLFWACLTAMQRARRGKVGWKELRRLASNLTVLAKRGPISVRRSRYAAMVRILGVRWTERIRCAVNNRNQNGDAELDPLRQIVTLSLAHNE